MLPDAERVPIPSSALHIRISYWKSLVDLDRSTHDHPTAAVNAHSNQHNLKATQFDHFIVARRLREPELLQLSSNEGFFRHSKPFDGAIADSPIVV